MPLNSQKSNLSFTTTSEASSADRIRNFVEWSIKPGKKIILFTGILVLISLFLKLSYIRKLNTVNGRLEDLKLEMIDNLPFEKEFNETAMDITRIKDIEAKRTDWYSRTKKISSLVPEDMIIIKTAYSANKVTIESEVKSIQGFAFFIQKALGDNQIDKIILTKSQYNNTSALYKFEVIVELKQ